MRQRILFFLGASVVALALAPIADPAFRWVAEAVSATYAVLALLAGLDALSRRRTRD